MNIQIYELILACLLYCIILQIYLYFYYTMEISGSSKC